MEDPSAPEITFVRAPCPSKEVLYVRCSDLGTNLLLIIRFHFLNKHFGIIMHVALNFFQFMLFQIEIINYFLCAFVCLNISV